VEAVGNIAREAIGSSDVRFLVSSRTLSTDSVSLTKSTGSSSYRASLTGILIRKKREKSSRAHITLPIDQTSIAVSDITENTLGVSSVGLESSLAHLAYSSSRAVETVFDATDETVVSSNVGFLVSSSTLTTVIGGLAESTGSGGNRTGLTGVLIG